MTITAQATAYSGAEPREILEFVLDLDRYRQIDRKIVRVSAVEGPDAAGLGSVKLWGRLRGMPPAPDTQNFVLERWQRLTFCGASGRPARLVFDFIGTFDCARVAGGSTSVTHSYSFTFKGPFRLLERWLEAWLQREVEAEVRDLVAAVSGASDAPGTASPST